MMRNTELASKFKYLGSLLELLGENAFKIKAYTRAAKTIETESRDLGACSREELLEIEGIGKAIADKILELAETGTLAAIRRAEEQVPSGLLPLLGIRGLSNKKLRQLWQELGLTSLGELLYACEENRLVELKGFGEKTQAALLKTLRFAQANEGLYRRPELEILAQELLHKFAKYKGLHLQVSGALRRAMPLLSCIDLLVEGQSSDFEFLLQHEELQVLEGKRFRAQSPEGIPYTLHYTSPEDAALRLLQTTGPEVYVEALLKHVPEGQAYKSEEELFAAANWPVLAPELRDHPQAALGYAPAEDLIRAKDIQGIVHAHSTYSDGKHSLKEMALACKERGYSYLVITDHSQSAFYAQGLKAERVRAQWAEIDALNTLPSLQGFRIYKGIESDILASGALDYEEDILSGFDLIIASVHSGLQMSEEVATERLLKAIAHPKTKILGHPTGRLLAARAGYSLDMPRILQACAEHGVAVELNAHPYRLDLDWEYIPLAQELGVKIAINPDAHSVAGLDLLRYGVETARKGWLRKSNLFTWPQS